MFTDRNVTACLLQLDGFIIRTCFALTFQIDSILNKGLLTSYQLTIDINSCTANKGFLAVIQNKVGKFSLLQGGTAFGSGINQNLKACTAAI